MWYFSLGSAPILTPSQRILCWGAEHILKASWEILCWGGGGATYSDGFPEDIRPISNHESISRDDVVILDITVIVISYFVLT